MIEKSIQLTKNQILDNIISKDETFTFYYRVIEDYN